MSPKRMRMSFIVVSFIIILFAARHLGGCNIGPITPPVINLPPTADAGVDLQRCVGQEAALDGLSSSDPDGDSLFYNWSSVRCAGSCDLDSANIPTPMFMPSNAGLYEFSLTVTDDRGGSDLDTIRVVVVDCGGSNPCEGVECPPEQVCSLDTGECEPTCEDAAACPDDDPCTDDLCIGGACHHIVIDCDDGLFCTGVETCVDGACVSSGDPCGPEESCDEDTGQCCPSGDPVNKSIAVCCDNSCGPCAPSGACTVCGEVQLCAPRYTTAVQTGPVLQLEYSVPDSCSSIRLNIYVDGARVHTTGWLGWPGAPPPFNVYPLSTGVITLSVSSGTHQLELEAEGQPGGCNDSALCSWGGTLTIQPVDCALSPTRSYQKISDTEGGFSGTLDNEDRFGFSAASLGDLDGDGVGDIAVGAPWDDDGGTDRGAVWVLFLNADATVKSHQKISDTQGAFTGALDNGDFFGWGMASLGDLDGDGVGDLAVGATSDDDGGTNRGAVWVLFLNADGTVNSHQKISNTQGGFTGALENEDWFGGHAISLGNLDGAGPSVAALAVSAWATDDGGTNRGAVWVLFLNADGTVNSHQKISDTAGGFTGALDDFDQFGTGLASLGDLDGDGVADLAVGANQDDDGGAGDNDRGALWVLFLNTDGTVRSYQKVSHTEGGFTGGLDDGDEFGSSVTLLGELDGDGIGDLAVAAQRDDDGGTNRGAVWLLFLNSDGTVKAHQKISDTQGGFTGMLDNEDIFGHPVEALGDYDSDGAGDLAVGAHLDDDGGTDRGAVWVLSLDGVASQP